MFQQLLITTIKKFHLPDDFEHDSEGANEDEFREYRRELKPILTNLGHLVIVIL
jgi:hypothetical protein